VTSVTVRILLLDDIFENEPLLPDGTPATQINCIVSHPTMTILVTAHEDKFIRIFDIVTGMDPEHL
jgi:hypothetical protein